MDEQQTLGSLPGRRVVHVLRHIHGVFIPACVNSFAAKQSAVVDDTAPAPTCRRCQRK